MAGWIKIKTLGKGGFGIVSLAKNTYDDEDQVLDLPYVFAVKSAEFESSDSLQKERELLYIFQGCDHIIQCYGADASEEDGAFFYNLMLEFASGGSLSDCIHRSRHGLLDDQVRQYTKSVLLGLCFIHDKGFVHCDLKPENILLVDDGEGRITAKISDFGLAKKVGKKGKERKRKKGFRGTPLYMAPESILWGEYEFKADIWALGCTVLEMFTKKPAWDFDERIELGELLDRISNEEVEIPCGLSKDAEDFLRKCLIKNPDLRWSADMLLEHPFVSCLDKSSVVCTRSEESILCFDSSSDGIDSIKPRLLMKAPVRLNKVTEDSVSLRDDIDSIKSRLLMKAPVRLNKVTADSISSRADIDSIKPRLLMKDPVRLNTEDSVSSRDEIDLIKPRLLMKAPVRLQGCGGLCFRWRCSFEARSFGEIL